MERMMKLQDVLLKAMAKKITWWTAAEIIGVSDRTMRRWRERLEKDGYSGLADRRKGKVSFRRVPLQTAKEVLGLYQDKYFDLNVRHFHEKLREEHDIQLSYSWVYQALVGAGLVRKRRRRGPHRRRRERRPIPGMLLHIDGSKHRWFSDDRWYDLLVILDDANSEIYYAQLVEEECTRTVLAALREVIETQGLFGALYSDRGSHFFVTPKAGEKVDKQRLTQVGRALRELGVQMIPAYSPQARGRSERNFGTWQGRLPQELRLAGIHTVEEANQFLRKRYIGEFNAKFTVAAAEKGSAFRRCSRTDLNWIFTVQSERVVTKDNTVAIGERHWQLDKSRYGDHSRTSGRHRIDSLRAAHGGKIQCAKATTAARHAGSGSVTRTTESACGSKELDRPLSRFPLRGQAGCTAASAALRLGPSAGPKQNANQRSGPVRKKASFIGGCAPKPPAPQLWSKDYFML
jgi:transposase